MKRYNLFTYLLVLSLFLMSVNPMLFGMVSFAESEEANLSKDNLLTDLFESPYALTNLHLEQINEVGNIEGDYKIGFDPPIGMTSPDDSGDTYVGNYLKGYAWFYTIESKEMVNQFLLDKTFSEIKSWDDTTNPPLKVNYTSRPYYADYTTSGNKCSNSFEPGQVDLITELPYGNELYNVYVASFGPDDKIVGLTLAEETIDNRVSMTPEQTLNEINNSENVEEVLNILKGQKLGNWNSITEEKQKDIAKEIFNGKPFNTYEILLGEVEKLICGLLLDIRLPLAMDAVNSATQKSEVQEAIDSLNPKGWSELTGTSKRTNVPDMILALRPNSGYKDTDAFMDAIIKGMAMGRTNDFNYYDNPLEDYIRYYDLINLPNFKTISAEQKFIFASLMKYFNGIGDDGYPIEFDYNKPLDFANIIINTIDSITTAQFYAPLIEDNEGLNVGKNSKMKNIMLPKDNEKVIYISNNSNIANIDLDMGYITPKSLGTVMLGYIIYNTNTAIITSYGTIIENINDEIPPTSEIYQLESGELNKIIILFDEEMHQESRDITDIIDMVDSITISRNDVLDIIEIASKPNSVTWITNRIVKISIPTIELMEGNIVTIQYKPGVMDLGKNQAPPIISTPVIKDETPPIGKILTPKTANVKNIRVMFNERMHNDTKSINNIIDLVDSMKIMKGMEYVKDISIESIPNSVQWIELDGFDEVNISIPDTVINDGEYIVIKYKDSVKDKAGNIVNTEPTVIPIGGALELDNFHVYDSIRKNAGGKMPKIAIVGSSRESLQAAHESYNDPTSAQGACAFIKHGFEPVFIPIAIDNYKAAAYSEDNIDLMDEVFAVYYQGGDQFKHARSFLRDDGSDTPLMTSMRYVYSSGGVITGSSAGDHILSDPMNGNGTSYGDMSHNGGIFNNISDTIIGDEDNDISGIMKGFGFAKPYALTDSHFDARGRLGRLIVIMRDTKQETGIGIDENAAIVLKGNMGTVLGDNGIFIVDGSNAVYNKRYDENSNEKFGAKGLKVNYLTHGDIYNFHTKEVVSTKTPISKTNGNTYYSKDIFGAYENTNLIKALVDSHNTFAYGITKNNNPSFLFSYSKDVNTNAYKTGNMYTIDGLNLNIIVNPVPVSGVKLDKKSINLEVDSSTNLTCIIEPSTAVNKNINWISENPTIASVDSGKIKGLSKGTTKIIVTTEDGNHQAECIVKVVDTEDTHYSNEQPYGEEKSKEKPKEEPKIESKKETILDREKAAPTIKKFNDLERYPWAKNAIEELTNKGILTGISDTEFAPEKYITREEFLGALIKTLKLESEFNDNFLDIKPEDENYKEIGIARALRIANGVGNNVFNGKAAITREEAIVFIERALRLQKNWANLANTNVLNKFIDKDKISKYAINSIALMVEKNIIKGNGNNINPKQNTTRAEAAVMLIRLLNQ